MNGKQEWNMAINDPKIEFTEEHHAMLFALISKAVIERAGEQHGEAIIRKAVRQYGAERGRRMALRAQANRHPRNIWTEQEEYW